MLCDRLVVLKATEILYKAEAKWKILSREIATKLKIEQKTVLFIRQETKIYSLFWFHMKNLINQISICELLLKRNKIEPFFWNETFWEMKSVSTTTIMCRQKCAQWNFTNGDKARIGTKKGNAESLVRLEGFMTSCSNLARPLIRLSTVQNQRD